MAAYADILMKVGRQEEGLEWYQKVLDKDPNHMRANIGYGSYHSNIASDLVLVLHPEI